MYVVLAKIETVKKVIGPFMTKDSATAARQKLMKNSNMRFVVRPLEQASSLSETTAEMETLWEDE